MSMLLVYADQQSPRLQYVLDLWFRELMPVPYRLTTDAEEFRRADAVKINYSHQELGEGLQVRPHTLLFESGICRQELMADARGDRFNLFTNQHGSYDPLAATFFLVTRYEEYLPHRTDQHGRFPDAANILVQHRCEQVPVVHRYVQEVAHRLTGMYRNFPASNSAYRFLLTYDIDLAFAYRFRPWWRTLGGYVRDVAGGRWSEVIQRTAVLRQRQPDPYDTFELQHRLHAQYGIKPIYFFLIAEYGRYHRNISWRHQAFRNLLLRIYQRETIGLHAGYHAAQDGTVLQKELRRLEKIIATPASEDTVPGPAAARETPPRITRNRFHFLRLRLPHSYRLLLQQGIVEDYSMGFTTRTGFRAGIAAPYFWYDLASEQVTDLRIFPVAVMDATLYYHLKLDEDQAMAQVLGLADAVRRCGGLFQFLAHNDLLADRGRWKRWSPCFSLLLQELSR